MGAEILIPLERGEATASAGEHAPDEDANGVFIPGGLERLHALAAMIKGLSPPAPPEISDAERLEWRRRLAEMDARIAARRKPGVTPEEIEADITAAYEEVRRERLAARRR